jgi:hypothetical protein
MEAAYGGITARSFQGRFLTFHLTTKSSWEIRRWSGVKSSDDPHEHSVLAQRAASEGPRLG